MPLPFQFNFFNKKESNTPIIFGSKRIEDANRQRLDNSSYKVYRDLYFSNYCVNRSINLIASNVAKMEVTLTKDNLVLEDSHWIAKILKNPNKNSFFADFIEQLIIEYLLYGNVFMFLDDMNQLVLIDMLKIDIYKQNGNICYEFIHNNDNHKILITDDLCKFGHFKNFNPDNAFCGYSSLKSIKSSILLYQYIDDYNVNFIKNGARPSGILQVDGLTDKQGEEMISRFYEEYSGENQAGKVIFLNRAFVWQPLSENSKDMDYTDTVRRTVRAISSGLGVPAILIGDLSLTGESSRSNLDSLFEIFYQTTIEPLANKTAQFLTMFFDKIEPGINVKFKKQNINSEN